MVEHTAVPLPSGGLGGNRAPNLTERHLTTTKHLLVTEGPQSTRTARRCQPGPRSPPASTPTETGRPYLSEPSLSTGVCEMPRLLEKSVLLEETLAKPFPPVITDSESAEGSQATGVPPGRGQGCWVSEASHSPGLLSYPAVTAAKVGLPFLPGREAALASLCLLPLGCFALESLGEEARRHPSVLTGTTPRRWGLTSQGPWLQRARPETVWSGGKPGTWGEGKKTRRGSPF